MQKISDQKGSRSETEALKVEMSHRGRLEQWERLSQFQGTMRQKYGELPSSAEIIQELREEREDEIFT